MKKCPTCEKTFDDNMKFCQTDGTPLVEVQDSPAEPEDPYKTSVAKADDLPIPQAEDPYKTVMGGSMDTSSAEPDTPKAEQPAEAEKQEEFDPMKTLVATDTPRAETSEPKAEEPPPPEPETSRTPEPTPFSAISTEPGESEQETPASAPSPEPPQFSEPDLSPPKNLADSSEDAPGAAETGDDSPSEPFAETPPPSPFAAESSSTEDAPMSRDFGTDADDSASNEPVAPPTSQNVTQKTSDGSEFKDRSNEPIPSPFDPSMPGYKQPETPMPPYKEAEAKAEALNTPFAEEVEEQKMEPAADWMNSPMPGGEMQNQEFGSNAPFQQPAAGVEGEDKTMAIIALVCGILSIPCCGFLTGIPAMIVGYMAKNKAENEPNIYGGRGLALAGLITGAIGTVLSVIVFILQIIFGVLGSI